MSLVLEFTGTLLAILGALIGTKVLGRDAAGFADLGLAIAGMIVGYPAGIALGLLAIKKIFHQKGSVLLGLVGGIVGMAATIALAEPLHLNSDPNLLFGAFFLLVTGLSLGGFYLKSGTAHVS
jgi:hypothetical protein